MAIVSTIIGGGIVGLPFAINTLGLVLGVSLNLLVCYITFVSGSLYLALRNIVPGRPNSLYEIGYMVHGRNAIFYVAIVSVVNSFGLMMIYFIVFSTTAA